MVTLNSQGNPNPQNRDHGRRDESHSQGGSSHHNDEEVNQAQTRVNPTLDTETLRALIASAVDNVVGNLESKITEITLRKQLEAERRAASQRAADALETERRAASQRAHEELDREIEERRRIATQNANEALDRVISRATARPPVIIERPAQSAPIRDRLGPRVPPQPLPRQPALSRLGPRVTQPARTRTIAERIRGASHREPSLAPTRVRELSHTRGNQRNPVQISETYYDDYEEEYPDEQHPEEQSGEVNSSLNLNDIARRVAQINQAGTRPEQEPGFAPSPFVARIRNEKLKSDEEIPRSVPGYDGTGCPYEHQRQFESRITLYGCSEDLMARLFVTSLVGHASSWFYSLKANSVSSYGQLIQEFTSYFKTNQRTSESSSSLFAMRQGKNEHLRDYIRRFNVAALRVTDLDLIRRKEILRRTLRSAKVKESIVMHAGNTMEGLREVLEKSCELEDLELEEWNEHEYTREPPRASHPKKEQRARSPKRARSPLPAGDLRRDIERSRND